MVHALDCATTVIGITTSTECHLKVLINGSLPCSQQSATGPSPEPDKSKFWVLTIVNNIQNSRVFGLFHRSVL
jgi:hypothetical protein